MSNNTAKPDVALLKSLEVQRVSLSSHGYFYPDPDGEHVGWDDVEPILAALPELLRVYEASQVADAYVDNVQVFHNLGKC